MAALKLFTSSDRPSTLHLIEQSFSQAEMAALKLITSIGRARFLRLFEQWCHALPLPTLLAS
eukprot:4102172-Karenia_brevis.AAC.1